MAKQSKLSIMNMMGDAADKKSRKAAEGSPEEEASESAAEAKSEGDMPGKKKISGKQIGAIKSKKK